MSNPQGGRGVEHIDASRQPLPAKSTTKATEYTAEPMTQMPNQAHTLQNLDNGHKPTSTGKPGRGKPQLKFFRGRFWEVFFNGDVVPARDEEVCAKLDGYDRES